MRADPPGGGVRRRDALAVAVVALALLGGAGWLFDASRLHVNGIRTILNDQVGYVSVARNLARHGRLESNLIYPSLVAQEGVTRNYLYMPGAYLTIAAAIRLLGDGVPAHLLPARFAFVAAAVCVLLLGTALYERRVGWLAALLFLLFPFNICFAVTAMAELPFVAAVAGAVCVFVHLPPRARPWFGPVLLVLPFLVRETGALVAIPMVFLLGGRDRKATATSVALFGVLSVLVLGAVYHLDVSSGRGSLWAPALLGGADALYHDAFWPRVHTTVQTLEALRARLWSNVLGLGRLDAVEGYSLALLLVAAVTAWVYGRRRHADDRYARGCAWLFVVAMALILVAYRIDAYRALRNVLFTVPLLAVVAARVVTRAGPPRVVLPLVVALASTGTAAAVLQLRPAMLQADTFDANSVAFLEGLGIDQDRLLVGPHVLCLPYLYAHPDVRWSFEPANDRTLAFLHRTYGIGTVILEDGDLGHRVSAQALANVGLEQMRPVMYAERLFRVFQPVGRSQGR